MEMDSKTKRDAASAPTFERKTRFTEAQRSNLTRLIKGSRFSVVNATDLAGQKVTGKPIG